MRFGIPLLLVVTAVALVGCSGGDDESAAPVPEAQRFVSAADAPGSKADPLEKRETTTEFDVFIAGLSDRAVDADRDEMLEVFDSEDFKAAGADARYFGETHMPESSTHVFSSFVEVGSEDGATSALDWLETDQQKPCPMSCAVQRSTFDVDGIAGARGVHRIATAEDIERVGNEDERPFDSYWIGFTDGPVVYVAELFGLPGSVTEEQAEEIAKAYHDRVTGA